MESYEFPWNPFIVWTTKVEKVLTYYADRPQLKFGAANLNKAFGVIDYICSRMSVTQSELVEKRHLSMDDIMTILSNVTMAIQGEGKVRLPPRMGGTLQCRTPIRTFLLQVSQWHGMRLVAPNRKVVAGADSSLPFVPKKHLDGGNVLPEMWRSVEARLG